jgi:hypothetical protein
MLKHPPLTRGMNSFANSEASWLAFSADEKLQNVPEKKNQNPSPGK